MSFRISRLLPKFLRGEKDKTKAPENPNDPVHQILLLDDTDFTVHLKPSHKGCVLLERIFDHLNLVERDFFGVRYIDQYNQTHWLDGSKSISSQVKGALSYKFYFGVKFYAADPCKLHEEITRYQFFLQVKRDILQGRLPVTFDEATELCGYAVQSELGDFEPKRHTVGYVSEFQLLPNQTFELEDRIASIHRELVGLVPSVAEYRYLEKAKWLEMYGVDLHPVLGEGHTEYFLGLTPMGIVVYKNKSQVASYLWPRITKVTFKGKVFTVRVKDKHNDEHPYGFELSTKAACKHLWKCCVEHHAFFRLNQMTESYKSAGKLFNFGSKYRYSSRMDRLLSQSGQYRPAPHVLRIPSRRHARRSSSEPRLDVRSSNEGIYDASQRPVTMVITPEPVQPPRYNYRQMPSQESPRSTRSAPWETNTERRGLYTSGRESPLSVRSEKMKFPGHRRPASGSESETGNRRRYYSSRKSSDNESEISNPRRRRRRENESGSESEAGYRRNLRQMRAKSAGEELINHEWRNGGYMQSVGKENIPNGSLNSLNEEERKRRRRRTRSKSPSNRPPQELRQHFEYDLIETEGMSEDQLKEIAYTSVETKAEPFKMKARHRYKSPKRRSFGESDANSRQSDATVTQEEAPPPYVSHTSISTGPSVSQNNAQNVQNNTPYSKAAQDGPQRPSPTVYRQESYTTPVQRTRPLSALQPSYNPAPTPNRPESRYLEAGAKMQLPPANTSNTTIHSPYWAGGNREGRQPSGVPRYANPPSMQQNPQQRYSQGYSQERYPSTVKTAPSRDSYNNKWNGSDHPYYQSTVDSIDKGTNSNGKPSQMEQQSALPDVTSDLQGQGYEKGHRTDSRPESDRLEAQNQPYRTPTDHRHSAQTSQLSYGVGRRPLQTSDRLAQQQQQKLQQQQHQQQQQQHQQQQQQQQPVHRPSYQPWSHFQPVKPSASPANQSNNSLSTLASSHSEVTRHVINAYGRQEKWTEL